MKTVEIIIHYDYQPEEVAEHFIKAIQKLGFEVLSEENKDKDNPTMKYSVNRPARYPCDYSAKEIDDRMHGLYAERTSLTRAKRLGEEYDSLQLALIEAELDWLGLLEEKNKRKEAELDWLGLLEEKNKRKNEI